MERRRLRQRKRHAPRPPLTIETKWGWMPCVEMGFCPVPAALLRYAPSLNLSPEEGWLLVQLLDLKWSEGRSTLDQLSERCRFSPDEIHLRLKALEHRGLLKLIPKNLKGLAANGSSAPAGDGSRPVAGWEVDLSPLLHALNDLIMRGGDLTAGFLRLSPLPLKEHP